MTIGQGPSFDPRSLLAKLGDGGTLGKYGNGQVVFSQGDPADAVFYIQKGKVKVTVVSEQGKEAVVALLGDDDFFGEACLAGQATRIATVAAMVESSIARIEKAAIVRLIQTEPAFSEMFIAHLLDRTIRVEADLVDQLFNSSEKRLARLLLLLANFGKEGKPEPIIAKISQETLAEMIGTTRSRVSFFMNKFRQLGFIDYNGGIAVHSSLLNVVLHDQPHIKTWMWTGHPATCRRLRSASPSQPNSKAGGTLAPRHPRPGGIAAASAEPRSSRREGATQDKVADVIGVDGKTLRKHYATELQRGAATVEAKLVGNLLKLASGSDGTALKAIMSALIERPCFSLSQVEPTGPRSAASSEIASPPVKALTVKFSSSWVSAAAAAVPAPAGLPA
jgi:CRP/FNR family cyclic AMP-dependent transcriptional regulator